MIPCGVYCMVGDGIVSSGGAVGSSGYGVSHTSQDSFIEMELCTRGITTLLSMYNIMYDRYLLDEYISGFQICIRTLSVFML